MNKAFLLAVLMWTLTPGAPVFAATDLSKPEEITKSFEIADLMAIAKQLGWDTELVDNDGKQILFVRLDQAGFFAVPTDCAKGRCIAVEFQALYSIKQVSPATLNAFNLKQSFAMAFSVADGDVRLSRLELCDFGIPVGGIAVSMQSFAKQTNDFSVFLSQSRTAGAASSSAGAQAFAASSGEDAKAAHLVLHLPADQAAKYGFRPGP
jgi:hypothetical protein